MKNHKSYRLSAVVSAVVIISILSVCSYAFYDEIHVGADYGRDAWVRVGDADNDGLNEIVVSANQDVAILSYDVNTFNVDSTWTLEQGPGSSLDDSRKVAPIDKHHFRQLKILGYQE